MTKVYGVQGRTSVEIAIPVGKATLPIEFTKGCLDRKNYRPATYTTDNKAIQDMIEGSSLFGRMIKLYKVYGADVKAGVKAEAKGSPKKSEGGAKPVEAKEYPEVKTLEEAIRILKSLGAKANNLMDEPSIKKYMNNKKVSFPNFSF